MKINRITRSSFWIFLVVLFLDQTSKYLVHQHLPLMDDFVYRYPYNGIGVFEDFYGIEFSISHATNTGAAWGIMANHPNFLIALRFGLIAALIIYILFINQIRSWQAPLFLVLAGAIGNVIDFFVYGHVVDMLHIILWGYDFPVFNIADSAITIGVCWLFLLTLFQTKRGS